MSSKPKPMTGAQSESLRLLWEKHHRFMLFVANRMVAKSDDADDVVQNVLLKLIRQIDRLSSMPDAELKRYLAAAIRHEAIDRGVYQQRHPSVDETQLTQLPGGLDTEGMVMLREEAARVLDMLRSLPEKEQAALRMKRLGGASDRQIADALGIAEASVPQYVRRARQKLMDRFGRREEES